MTPDEYLSDLTNRDPVALLMSTALRLMPEDAAMRYARAQLENAIADHAAGALEIWLRMHPQPPRETL